MQSSILLVRHLVLESSAGPPDALVGRVLLREDVQEERVQAVFALRAYQDLIVSVLKLHSHKGKSLIAGQRLPTDMLLYAT